MKIKFFSNYDSSDSLLKRFKDNYPINDDLLQFTTGEDYEVAVVFNKFIEGYNPNAKVICIVQEPSWSPVWQNERFNTYADYILVHDKSLFNIKDEDFLGVIETPSYMWFHDHVNYNFFKGTDKVKKKKKISMIVSGLNMTYANYTKRINVVQQILNSDLDIDIFGRGLPFTDKRIKGAIENKFQGLLPYEFSIAIENSNEKNYITEKYIDCVLCNTIPIYNGAPNIEEVYNPIGHELINLDSETIVDDIKTIIGQTFIKKHFPILNKEIYFEQHNLYEKLKEILL